MPDPSSALPTAPLLFPHHSDAMAEAIALQFSNRPTLRQIVEQQLCERIQESYPPLHLDMRTLKLATPNQRGGWDLKLLTDVALSYLSNGERLNLTASVGERRCFLTQQTPIHLTFEANGPKEPDMAVIENLIWELGPTLPISFQQALTDYWNLDADTGVSRWQWLGDLLADNLSSTASLLPASQSLARDMLNAVIRHPDRRDRQADAAGIVYAYCLEAIVINKGISARLLSTDLLLVQGPHILLCTISGGVESFSSIEDFTRTWGLRLESLVLTESIQVNRYEPDGNLFDIQAALLLTQQLDDLAAIALPAANGVHALVERFAEATNPASGFGSVPAPDPTHFARIQAALPEWLKTANADDRFAYRHQMIELARLQQQTGGASFLDGVENLRQFSARTLREQIRSDHPGSTVDPLNLELTFHVPVGDLHGGYLTPVKMSLIDLAIKNLSAAPQGRMTLRDTTGADIPAWLTQDYVLGEKGLFHSTPGLISQVDIGRSYPQNLRELLLGDNADARRRVALFEPQLTARLPLQALEHKIRGEHGFTSLGYRYVKAVLRNSTPERTVAAQDIIIRPLAFARAPGAVPDIVSNMFIIEPRDTTVGPHILYRPLYRDSLQQFASRAALFDAIAQPGALQDSVLEWLSERARPIYSHDGFHSPHILRFGQGDDTVQWSAPPPAQLVQDINGGEVPGSLSQSLAAGNLTQYLYGSNARTLVDLADRDSVSNAENRWAVLLEGGWLVFNALLMPLLQGPAMWVGWMAQLAISLEHDLAALRGDDATARELAWVDVLLNVGLILLHVASVRSPPSVPSARVEETRLPLTLAALLRPPSAAARPAARIGQGPIGLPSEPPARDATLVDFVQSNARDASRRRLLDALLDLHVAWPNPAPAPLEIGALKGLYRIKQQWHASVAGLLFRVNVLPRAEEVYLIHPQKAQHPGFKLVRNAKGQWTLDMGLKLRGGGPKSRLQAKREEIQQKRAEAISESNRLNAAIHNLIDQTAPSHRQLDAAEAQLERASDALKLARAKLLAAPDNPALLADHAQKSTARTRARLNFEVLSERYDQAAAEMSQLRLEQIKAYAQLKEAGPWAEYESKCVEQYLAILSVEELRVLQRQTTYLATLLTDQGEPVVDLLNAPHAYAATDYLYDLLETTFAASEKHAAPMITIERTLEDMATQLKTGPAQRLKYLKANPTARYFGRLFTALDSLSPLYQLSVNDAVPVISPPERFYRHFHEQLSPLESSHQALMGTEGFTHEERKAVLTNLLGYYRLRLHIYQSLVELESPIVRKTYMPLLIERLNIVRESAEADLADLLRENEFLPPQPNRLKTMQAPSNTKRVFKARDKGPLVGDLEPAQAGMPFETIVTRNPITEQITGRFMEHPGEGWVEIVNAPAPQPVKPKQVPSLAALRTRGQRLIEEVSAIERSIDYQKKKLAEPARRDEPNPRDWYDMLVQQAESLDTVAADLVEHHEDKPDIALAATRLRQRASELREQGTQLCVEGYKAQRPRQERIEFLRDHGAVDIGLVHGPKRTAAKDYVTELAIREKNSTNVLWYAHFHYSSANSAPAEYTAAHLKRPDQRFLTLKDLITQAGADNQSIVRDLYSPITAPLDQRLFLNLIPA